MSQALYRKWRPRKWDEVVGQEHVIQTLRNAVASERVAHAYLFSGPRGTGKTTAARLLAKAVNCLAEDLSARPCNQCEHCKAVNENRFLDLIEIDAASQTGVEDVRDLRDKINFSPNQGRYKVYIIDEVHMFSTSAFNALLKTLEEPPAHAIFVLATTEIHKIPPTVLSRCQRHEFRRVPVMVITGQLNQIVKEEKLDADEDALTLIARQATGSMRDAISLLDQLASTGQKITLGLTQTVLGTAASQTVFDVLDAIMNQAPTPGLEAIHSALDSGTDARVLARQIVDYLRALLLAKMGNEASLDLTSDARTQVRRHAQGFPAPELLRMIRLFNSAANDLRGGWQPSLTLELALAEAMEVPTVAESAREVAEPAKTIKPQASQQTKIAKSEPVPAVVPDETTHEKGVTFEQVSKSWKQIRAIIKPQNPALEGLLNSCKLLGIKDGTLVLGFSSEVVKSKMDKPEQIEITSRAITEVLGVAVPVRCVVTSAKAAPPHVKPDGMVAAALQNGGEIVDIQE